jgi:hypothetical protein
MSGENIVCKCCEEQGNESNEKRECGHLNITVNGVRMEDVECFRYLGVDIDRDGGMKNEMKHRVSLVVY